MEAQIIEKREKELLEATKLAFKLLAGKGKDQIKPEKLSDLDDDHAEFDDKHFPRFDAEDAKDIIEEFHKYDSDGGLDLAEFYAIVKDTIKSKKMLKEGLEDSFKIFDKTKNFLISAEEFKAAMEMLGKKLTDDELQDMMTKPAYINGDNLGKTDFDNQTTFWMMNKDMEKKKK